MRNPILAITIAFVLAAPCTALAGGKKDTIEVQSPSHQITQPTSASRGKVEFNYTSQNPDGPKTLNAVGGSTGPTKPPLPTTGTQHR
jgi:hypothetical protein